jgi:RHS repeat-associated protein
MNLWFRSSEHSDSNYWPKLEITYSTQAQTVYFLKDHLGSIRATVLDSATAPVIGYDDYDPWGYPLATRTQVIPTPYLQGGSKIKFTGKEYDDEFGLNLVYFGARYYDWLRGQWISVEPLAEKYPSLSPYAYVANNPVNAIDRDGNDIINNTKRRTVAIIGGDYVGPDKTVMRYKLLAPGQNSRFIYDAQGNWTGWWDFTDYDFFNYEGVWYKAPSPDAFDFFKPKTWLPPINYWITDKWGANHPFNFLVREATLDELIAIRDWMELAGAPKEAIEEIKRVIEKAEREQQKQENQGKSKKSKSDEKKQKQKNKDRNKDDAKKDPHAGWGAENQGPPPR